MFAVFDDFITRFRRPLLAITMLAALLVTGLPGSLAAAESVAYQQAVAMAAGKDREVLEFYKARGFKPIWTSSSDVARRRAFIEAAAGADGAGADDLAGVERFGGRDMGEDGAEIVLHRR